MNVRMLNVVTGTEFSKLVIKTRINSGAREDFFRKKAHQRNLTGSYSQPAFTCSKLIIETVKQGVKYVEG